MHVVRFSIRHQRFFEKKVKVRLRDHPVFLHYIDRSTI